MIFDKPLQESLGKKLAALGIHWPKTRPGLVVSLLKQGFLRLLYEAFPSYTMGRFSGERDSQKILEMEQTFSLLHDLYEETDFLKGLLINLLYLNLADGLSHQEMMSKSYGLHAIIMAKIPFPNRAIRYGNRALRLAEKLHHPLVLAQAHTHLGIAYYHVGETDRALDHLHLAETELFLTSHLLLPFSVILYKGYCWRLKGNIPRAIRQAKLALELANSRHDDAAQVKALAFFGEMKALGGASSEAMKQIPRLLSCADKIKGSALEAIIDHQVAGIYLLSQFYGNAFVYAQKAALVAKKFDLYVDEQMRSIPLRLAEIVLKKWGARLTATRRDFLKKLKRGIMPLTSFPNHSGLAWHIHAEICLALGKRVQAERALKKSIIALHALGARYHLGRSYASLANLLLEKKDPQGKTYLLAARDLFEQCRARADLKALFKTYGMLLKRREVDQEIRHYRRMENIIKATNTLHAMSDPDQLLEQAMDVLIEIFGAEQGFIMLRNHQGELTIRSHRKTDPTQMPMEEFSFHQQVAQATSRETKGLLIVNAQTDARFRSEKAVDAYGIRSVLSVPLFARGENLGVIYLGSRLITNLFTRTDLELLHLFAAQTAISLKNAIMLSELRALNASLTQQLEELSQEIEELKKSHHQKKAA